MGLFTSKQNFAQVDTHYYSTAKIKVCCFFCALYACTINLIFVGLMLSLCYTPLLFTLADCYIAQLEPIQQGSKKFITRAQVLVVDQGKQLPLPVTNTSFLDPAVQFVTFIDYCQTKTEEETRNCTLAKSTKFLCTYQTIDQQPLFEVQDELFPYEPSCFTSINSYNSNTFIQLLAISWVIIVLSYLNARGCSLRSCKELHKNCFCYQELRSNQACAHALPYDSSIHVQDLLDADETVVWTEFPAQNSPSQRKTNIIVSCILASIIAAYLITFITLQVTLHMYIIFAGCVLCGATSAIAIFYISYKCFTPYNCIMTNKRLISVQHIPFLTTIHLIPYSALQQVKLIKYEDRQNKDSTLSTLGADAIATAPIRGDVDFGYYTTRDMYFKYTHIVGFHALKDAGKIYEEILQQKVNHQPQNIMVEGSVNNSSSGTSDTGLDSSTISVIIEPNTST